MFREYLRIAARALRAHRFRSLLTVSSITLGAFSIVLMSSLAESGLTTIARDIENIGGARVIMIAPKRPERALGREASSPGRLTTQDRDVLYAALPHLEARAMYSTLDRKDASNDAGKIVRTDVVAADSGFFEALRLDVAAGRTFTEEENRTHARVCVVADDLAKKLWDGDALGRWLTVETVRCQVIGKLVRHAPWDTNFGFEWLDFVALPFETAAETYPYARDDAVLQLRTDHVSSNDIVKRIANALLVDRHRGVDDYQIWDFNAFMANFYVLFAVMEAVVGLIAGIALVVGGIGVMNMMLVGVSERTREIGVRKALGADPHAIAAQFLAEATVLAGSGGLAGVLAGVAAAAGANVFIRSLQPVWVGEVSIAAAAVAILASLLIGVGFGWFPARAAGRLDPVAAMRR